MLRFYNNFSHKFLESKRVYAITNNNHNETIYKNFLSIPYKSDAYKIDTNVLIGFNNEKYSKNYIDKINCIIETHGNGHYKEIKGWSSTNYYNS